MPDVQGRGADHHFLIHAVSNPKFQAPRSSALPNSIPSQHPSQRLGIGWGVGLGFGNWESLGIWSLELGI
jgi:hypothetical protein